MPRDAEAWLAQRGIERDPIRVAPPQSGDRPPSDDRAPVSPREAARLATESQPPPAPPPAPPEQPGEAAPVDANLEDAVRQAVATARRITAQAPQSEARLRGKLADRDLPDVVVDLALERCRKLGIVDDDAYAAALVEERRRKGHAPALIRRDLGKRGIPDDVLDRALAGTDREDPEAAAFGVARRHAPRYATLEPEVAYRRLVGSLVRRGHREGLARKVARQVVYVEREAQRTAER